MAVYSVKEVNGEEPWICVRVWKKIRGKKAGSLILAPPTFRKRYLDVTLSYIVAYKELRLLTARLHRLTTADVL
jgi:hypothetical protein